MNDVKFPRAAFVAALLVSLAWGAVAAAHPRHEAVAEAAWNRKSGRLEVAMRLRPEDLEEVLTRMLRSERRVNLDTTPDVDRHLADYLQARFTLHADGRKARQPFHWVGKEVDLRYAWVYFEITMPQAPKEATLSCSVLMDLLPDQVNTVLLTEDKETVSWQFSRLQTRRHPWRPTPREQKQKPATQTIGE